MIIQGWQRIGDASYCHDTINRPKTCVGSALKYIKHFMYFINRRKTFYKTLIKDSKYFDVRENILFELRKWQSKIHKCRYIKEKLQQE